MAARDPYRILADALGLFPAQRYALRDRIERAARRLERGTLTDPETRREVRSIALELLELTRDEELSPQEAAWVAEYSTSLSLIRAKEVSGLEFGNGDIHGSPYLKNNKMHEACQIALAERAARSELTAEYVRKYILDILDVDITKYFILEEEEGVVIADVEALNAAPHYVKRLVEHVDMEWRHGKPILRIQFISKTAALAMAAKYALTQKISITQGIDFDALAKAEYKGSLIVDSELDRFDAEIKAKAEGAT